ncbi:hypothetical protein [Paracoccus marinaquae]|uniref:Uncharacterized protein n=1 Tax=Paracoccus marinaquae TaxID=2841926 RepID=A0ABS6ADH7_9RHOB|nr:hypothetical protein [Paracoccus marinaquae]MBU3028563.1 hypothetical protein [Paracoccus marinaquae]
MARSGNLIHVAATAAFIVGGIAFALDPQSEAQLAALNGHGGVMLTLDPRAILPLDEPNLTYLFLNPANPVMWALLVALWILLALDAAGQWLDPSDAGLRQWLHGPSAGQPAWPPLAMALALTAIWPWFLAPAPWIAAAGATAAAGAAFVAALRGSGQRRPTIGFFAGWSLAVAAAANAIPLARAIGLPMTQVAILTMLPTAILGVAAQLRIGREIGFSIAVIWAFCGVAATTMGVDPVIALAAILGIAAMAGVLVSVAT